MKPSKPKKKKWEKPHLVVIKKDLTHGGMIMGMTEVYMVHLTTPTVVASLNLYGSEG